MDSYALAFQERPDIAVTIDYGQRPAAAEIQAAKILTDRLSIQHITISVDLSALGSGDLAGIPAIENAPASDWWPYRNQALITFAAMRLIPMGIDTLLIATVGSDSNHRDGTKEFVRMISDLLEMQEGAMLVKAPAINMSTANLVKKSGIPYSLLAWAHSCHTDNIACGQCRGCVKHREVVAELGYAEA
ncbi:MAG: 7-cyano-7-deazaguanine synthase [Candidatus Thiodiazotropha sp. (ex Lucinoma borealis)]|nr:7-cyano-7-deazaguanine synthase [Candidatus Thiodiazotropha sp. (ex Lucinoma borealis)]